MGEGRLEQGEISSHVVGLGQGELLSIWRGRKEEERLWRQNGELFQYSNEWMRVK
jgi:hypothetical protein